ncbi:thioredoxin family protein [bacterium]|nr:thioredoxin family protein [bacterium]MCK5598311.1 thioredoxin family protein [bacterium]
MNTKNLSVWIVIFSVCLLLAGCVVSNADDVPSKKKVDGTAEEAVKTAPIITNSKLEAKKTETPVKVNNGETAGKTADKEEVIVTFVELGSVKCIPCRQMVPVMEAVEKQYQGKVKVVFHDVWTDEGKPYAKQYKIRVIPTQVFLDSEGKEFHRHEGFYPKDQIDKILNKKGL